MATAHSILEDEGRNGDAWSDADERDSGGLVDEIAQQIQRRIVEGDLAVGTWLRQSNLAAEMGVSRTPVREALRKLQAAGFVEVHPHRGAVVRGLDARRLDEAFVVRAELEGLASELAAELANDDQLSVLRQSAIAFDDCVEELTTRPSQAAEVAVWKANEQFHRAILGAADNECLTRSLQDAHLTVFTFNAVWGAILTRRTHILRKNIEEHREILAALEAHDPARARQAMREHILGSRELIIKALRI